MKALKASGFGLPPRASRPEDPVLGRIRVRVRLRVRVRVGVRIGLKGLMKIRCSGL